MVRTRPGADYVASGKNNPKKDSRSLAKIAKRYEFSSHESLTRLNTNLPLKAIYLSKCIRLSDAQLIVTNLHLTKQTIFLVDVVFTRLALYIMHWNLATSTTPWTTPKRHCKEPLNAVHDLI
jgi:hypothetical protein